MKSLIDLAFVPAMTSLLAGCMSLAQYDVNAEQDHARNKDRYKQSAEYAKLKDARLKMIQLDVEYSQEQFDLYESTQNTNMVELFRLAGSVCVTGAPLPQREVLSDPSHHLCWAAAMGEKEMVRLLLHRGTPVDEISGNPLRTPLMAACASGEEDIVRILIENGADVNLGITGVWYTVEETPLICAISSGSTRIARYLVETGASVIHRNAPVAFAAGCENWYLVDILLKAGGDIDAAWEDEWTPVALALAQGRPDKVRYLLRRGAKIDWKILRQVLREREYGGRREGFPEAFKIALENL